MMTANPAPVTIDDLEGDLHHLAHLLDFVVSHMQGMDHSGDGPDGRNIDLERADALIWIARDMADKLANEASAISSASARERHVRNAA